MDYMKNRSTVDIAAGDVAYDEGLRSFMVRIYNYMMVALVLTGLTSYFAAHSEAIQGMMYNIVDGQISMSLLGWVIVFAPLAMALGLGAVFDRLSYGMARVAFLAFSVVMGISLSYIFLIYTGESIARTFFITAITFGGMSLYGYTTKKDLTSWGSFLIMGVWGLIVASIVNIFVGSSDLSLAISAIAVIVFTGLIAYNTQNLKSIYFQIAGADSSFIGKAAIMGALNLYINFINLFVSLLRFIGERR